jgi:hypothetical protein
MTEVQVRVPVAKVTTWAKIKKGDVVALELRPYRVEKAVYRVESVEPCGYASIRAKLIGPDGRYREVVKRETTMVAVVG